MSFDGLYEEIEKLKKININEEAETVPGSYIDVIQKTARYVAEVLTAIDAAKESVSKSKTFGAYRTTEEIKKLVDTVEKSIFSAENIVKHAVSQLKKLGA